MPILLHKLPGVDMSYNLIDIHFRRTMCNKILFLNLEKVPQKHMECFRLLLEHLAWIEHQFLSGIRDSSKAGSLWGMMRGVGGVRKSIHQSWVRVRVTMMRFYGSSGRDSVGRGQHSSDRVSGIGSGTGQWYWTGVFSWWNQEKTPVHNSILATDYLTKRGIKTVPRLP